MSARAPLVFALVLALAAAVVPTAAADGPVAGAAVLGAGVANPAGFVRYVAVGKGRGVEVQARRAGNGVLLRTRAFRRAWGIPMVTYGRGTGGLSTDGSTLVLGSTDPRLRPTSRFLVLDAPSLRTRAMVRLRGSFSFDALSPDGSMLYLIQHVSRRDASVYAVRAYDLDRHRLLARVIADRTAWGATMRGYPLTRAVGRGGRWVYTLYMSASGMPFIHALDTVRARAVCVDVPWRGSQDGLWALRLALRDRKSVV